VYRAGSILVKSLGVLAILTLAATAPTAGDDQERLERARYFEDRLAEWQARVLAGGAEQVLVELGALTEAAERDPRLHNVRGLACASLGRVAEAVTHYETGIRLDPTRTELHFNLAVALLELGVTGRALSEFEQTLELDPGSIEARIGLGNGLARLRRHRPAIEVLETALALAPQDPRVLRALAEAYDGAGDHSGAGARWGALDRIAPSADSARRLGELARADDEPEMARAHFVDCVERDPSATDCAEAAGALALAAGDLSTAGDLLAPRLEQLSEVGLFNLLMVYERAGDGKAVEALLSRREPGLGGSWGLIALVRRAEGQQPEALAAVRRAIGLSPESADLHTLEGVLLEESGKRIAARAAWQRALALDPSHAEARANLEATRSGP
jgi:tetratricopeptide (TPR) repeat protein